MTEVLRSHDGARSILRETDTYVIYREDGPEPVEAWSCRTLTEPYAWMAANGLCGWVLSSSTGRASGGATVQLLQIGAVQPGELAVEVPRMSSPKIVMDG